jgi:protein phosphatase
VCKIPLVVDSFGVSDKGRVRSLNEDGYLVEPQTGLWLVADGMGGHDAGEVASGSIIEHLATMGIASSAPDLRARFEDRLGRAHSEIRALAAERGATIGSTVAALLAFDGQYACMWSGDSRIYRIRDGAISQMSRDHTEVQELVDRGVISRTEALSWPRRNVITRAIGVTDDVLVDVEQGQTRPGDVFVIGTDGLTAHVSDEEIKAAAAGNSARAACEKLLETVLARGATDNVTVVVVRFDDSDATVVGDARAA